MNHPIHYYCCSPAITNSIYWRWYVFESIFIWTSRSFSIMTWYRFGNGVLNGSQYHDWSNLLMRRQLFSNGHRFVYHSFSLDIFFISHISDLSGIKMWTIEYKTEKKGFNLLFLNLERKNLWTEFLFFYDECSWFEYSEIFHLFTDILDQTLSSSFIFIWINRTKL